MTQFHYNNRFEINDSGHTLHYAADANGAIWHYDRMAASSMSVGVSAAGEAGTIRVLYADTKYRTKYTRMPYSSMPSEG